MRFLCVQWPGKVEDKVRDKHHVTREEVKEALDGGYPLKGRKIGDLLHCLGRTDAGRYLFILVRPLGADACKILTARQMDDGQKAAYHSR